MLMWKDFQRSKTKDYRYADAEQIVELGGGLDANLIYLDSPTITPQKQIIHSGNEDIAFNQGIIIVKYLKWL
jgi:hypothetical protein